MAFVAVGAAIAAAAAGSVASTVAGDLLSGGGGGSSQQGAATVNALQGQAIDQGIAGEQKLNLSGNVASPISSGATAQASDGIDRSGGNPLSYGSKMRMAMLGTTADPEALAMQWHQATGG